QVVTAAEEALEAYGAAAVDAYIFALDNHPPLVRRSALPMLARLGDKALDPLVHALGHSAATVRLNALTGLRLLGKKVAAGARPAVAVALADEARDVRLEARRALDLIDGVAPPALTLEPRALPLPDFDTASLDDAALAKAKKGLDAETLEALLFD